MPNWNERDAFSDWSDILPHPDIKAKCVCGHERAQHEVQRGGGGGKRLHCTDRDCKCELYSEYAGKRREGTPAEEPTASARFDPSEAA